MTTAIAHPLLLSEPDWLERRRAHEARVSVWTDPHQARRSRGERHPTEDFLWEYYSFRASWLRRWHPGPDVVLLGDAARDYLRWPEYELVRVNPASGTVEPIAHDADAAAGTGSAPRVEAVAEPAAMHGVRVNVAAFDARRRDFLTWLAAFLRNTQNRPPAFACFGLHEWAMVYRLAPHEVRHAQLPLRFSPEETARITESLPVRCTHFDAFRFFTAAARPLNRVQPERATTPQLEQRGCLHANMDLYKWAYKLAPFTPSELLADCFAFAREIREIDMRASPYDCTSLGLAPIAIETPEGRADYERRQRDFAERSQPLRTRLLALCERLCERLHAG